MGLIQAQASFKGGSLSSNYGILTRREVAKICRRIRWKVLNLHIACMYASTYLPSHKAVLATHSGKCVYVVCIVNEVI